MPKDSKTELKKFANALWREDLESRDNLKNELGIVFAYYTSAETALKIVHGESIFMRDARLLNDSTELSYGKYVLNEALSENSYLVDLIGSISHVGIENIRENLVDRYDSLSGLRGRTFLTSLTRHDLKTDSLGRLSMWRGYGAENGVALLIHSTVFSSDLDWRGIFSTPVKYHSVDESRAYISRCLQRAVSGDIDWGSIDGDQFSNLLSDFFQDYCISAKHPGFSEEREWRVYCVPERLESPWAKRKTCSISGVPQLVLDLNIAGPTGDLKEVLLGAIIGPSPHQEVIAEALQNKLDKKGFPNNAVYMSPTPWVSAN